MQLKIVNPSAKSFHESIGISEERSNEICNYMTTAVESYPKGTKIYLSDLMQKIAAFCNTQEELIFAAYTHGRYASYIDNNDVFMQAFNRINRKGMDNKIHTTDLS